ncbi:MAG TPA: SbcC/MukB-like Walker B domain-containing protein [Lachnospiraceae bacterium]|nr:SbcC/MukB-like Walker B domain-containing protein [Lachnospiraceae bacterium]
MKKLTRMKLINWHRFTDTIIDFGDSTLISGENGAGKSTLLDAIQFVVTCSTNHFNKAAHENGKRKLTGYIRCKTGRENHPYERNGEISAHIALEFYEESKNSYFIIGAVVDSATEGQETVFRYLMDNCMFEDDMFKEGKQPRTITEFRTYNSKKIKQSAKTQAEAKKIIKQRFGRIEDKFFQLIPKAMAFKPIDDIKDFVYSYVLDEKEVNIDTLRENVRSYQELEQTLEGVKKRIEKLKEIEQYYNEVTTCIQADKMYEFFLTQSDYDITGEHIKTLQKTIETEQYRLTELTKIKNTFQKEWNNKNEIYTALLVEMKQNKQYQVLEEQKKQLEYLQEKRVEQEEEQKQLITSGKAALQKANKLSRIKDADSCIREYEELLRHLKDVEDIVVAKELVNRVITYKKEMQQKLQKKMLEVQLEIQSISEKTVELTEKIKKLERRTFSYPVTVELLKGKIEQEFLRLGRTAQPRVLCELLEIVNEKWRNAVEGYLNTQRFYLLVEPEHFDIALGVYEKLRKEKKVYGVGLINTGKLEAYDTVPEGSLASMVESKSIYAKRYINMILGKVHMCDRFEDLKKYEVSITANCMRYQNHVASAIKPQIYEQPFIGQNAVKIQLEQTKMQLAAEKEKGKEQENRLDSIIQIIEPLETEDDIDIKYRIEVLSEIKRTKIAIDKCEKEIKELEKHATYIEKQIQADKLKAECDKLQQDISLKDREIGSCQQKIQNSEESLTEARVDEAAKKGELSSLSISAGENYSLWKKEYDKQTESKSYEQFRINFDRRRKANHTNQETATGKMTAAMVDYKTAFDFGAAAILESYPEYAAIYDRLVHSELLSYEEKVTRARMAAEEEFREQFLSKLQENMKQAQGEFKELNRALKDIVFSNEKYEFMYLPSKKLGKYYDMIMDDFNVVQGESIFSGLFHENHKEVIEELFSKLALDQENSAKTLDEFTDYRTYMDYDIKIIHDDGNYSYYSKVCEEKSGGETQTPFYVTVAASFVQLYSSNIGGEAIGLIMFDEAFNNMDDERIGGVLEFLNRLPLQIIIAAPPDKIQYIGPKMEETLLVLTDHQMNYVEEYRYDAVREENIEQPS